MLYSTSLGTSRISRNDIAWCRTNEAQSYIESRLEQSCNLGWEDKSNWCLRSLELAAFNSAPILLLQLFQASVVAFTTDMNWKTPVFWNCCSSCTSFFWALVFPVVRQDHSSLHIFFFFSSWEGCTAWRKESKAVPFAERVGWRELESAQLQDRRHLEGVRGRGISGVKWTEKGWPWGISASVQCEMVQTGSGVLGGRRILCSTVGVGRGRSHSHPFGSSLSTFLRIILGAWFAVKFHSS